MGTILGIAALPFYAGGELLQTHSALTQRLGKLVIGVWHAFLQVAIPFVLIRRGGYLTWLAAAVAMFIFSRFGTMLMKRNHAHLLVLVWIAYGAVMVTLPWWTTSEVASPAVPMYLVPVGLEQTDKAWLGLGRSLAAAVVGAITACSLFGWYLAVCFMFNGHNNEAGGAARIEQFKEFVRVCLRKDSVTVYVIAVDQPERRGADLQPKIVDVFTLRPKAAP